MVENITFIFNSKVALDMLLYNASKSEQFRKSRKTSRFIFISIILLISLLFIKFNLLISVCFMALGVISFIVFPQYLGYYYKKHFSKIIKTEDYKNRIDQSFNISFNNEFIEVKNNHIQAKHNVGNFEYISETNEYFFIKLKAGDFLAYPKEQINDFDTLKTYFKNICTKNKIEYKNEYGWKWK